MPRANRCILPGYTDHLTHRCHNRSWLFRFARDRTEYCRRLRLAVKEFDVSLLTFCITSDHTHLLAQAEKLEQISARMQKLEGEFAEYYNIRKRRSGAFWSGRYHCTIRVFTLLNLPPYVVRSHEIPADTDGTGRAILRGRSMPAIPGELALA